MSKLVRLYPFVKRLIHYCLKKKTCLYVLLRHIYFLFNQIFRSLILGLLFCHVNHLFVQYLINCMHVHLLSLLLLYLLVKISVIILYVVILSVQVEVMSEVLVNLHTLLLVNLIVL